MKYANKSRTLTHNVTTGTIKKSIKKITRNAIKDTLMGVSVIVVDPCLLAIIIRLNVRFVEIMNIGARNGNNL